MANAHHNAEQVRDRLNYDPFTGVFTWKMAMSNSVKVGQLAGNWHPHGYLRIRIDDIMYRAHRLAWIISYGEWPSGVVDHINRNPKDNRLVNLRDISQKQNMENSGGRKNFSGVKGVYWHKKNECWRAQICHNQKHYHIGVFSEFEDAVRARKEAEKTFFTCSPGLSPKDTKPELATPSDQRSYSIKKKAVHTQSAYPDAYGLPGAIESAPLESS